MANKIFDDGVYNWGRIVTLLYFGFKLASSVVSQVPLLKLVVDWVVRFVKERLVNWIVQQGGWVSFIIVLCFQFLDAYQPFDACFQFLAVFAFASLVNFSHKFLRHNLRTLANVYVF